MNLIEQSPVNDSNLPYVEFDGHNRVLACLQHDPVDTGGMLHFEAVNDVLPETAWLEIDLQHYDLAIVDQLASSSCVSQAITKGSEYVVKQHTGKTVTLNSYFLYGIISHGVDRGSKFSEGLAAAQLYGVCEENLLPNRVVYAPYDKVVYDNAAKFKLSDALILRTFEQICTAITRGFVTPLGIYVGQNFSQIDSDGICPLATSGVGRHAVLGIGLKKHKRYGWLIKIQNSWGKAFGMNGFSYIHKEFFEQSVNAFAMRGLVYNSIDFNTEDDIPVAA